MISVVVDVDDTLINTQRRMRGVWRELLGREVPMEVVETLGLAQIFEKFASSDQKARANELRKRFWDILLCLENVGIELAELDEPIPFAAEVLQKWSKYCQLVYLTGRTENTRDLTLDHLRKFGFPTDNIQLVMFNLEDYARARGLNPSGTIPATLPSTDNSASLKESACCAQNDIHHKTISTEVPQESSKAGNNSKTICQNRCIVCQPLQRGKSWEILGNVSAVGVIQISIFRGLPLVSVSDEA